MEYETEGIALKEAGFAKLGDRVMPIAEYPE
jgi:hypothetical protein